MGPHETRCFDPRTSSSSPQKVTPATDQERPEKENENPFVDVLLMDNSLSFHAPLSRREKPRSPDLPITPSHEDLDPKEHPKSGNCLTYQRKTMYANTSSSAHFPSRKARSKSIRHQRFNVWLPPSCCNVRDIVLHLSADVLKRTDKPQLSMPRSWLKGRRKLRKPRSSAERDPPLTEKAEPPRAPSDSDQIRET